MSARWLIIWLVFALPLTVVGCEEADECKVVFELEGETHTAEWWDPHVEVAIPTEETGKADACAKHCAEIAPGDKASACTTAYWDAPMGCQTKTRFGL